MIFKSSITIFTLLFFLVCNAESYFSSSEYIENMNAYKSKAESGDVEAQITLGNEYLRSEKKASAKKWYRMALSQGDAFAALQLARIYCDDGEYILAKSFLDDAKKLGSFEADLYLGVMHEHGVGFVESETVAIEHYTKAAESGSVDAMMAIGSLYKTGNGVRKNLKMYKAWYERAIDGGSGWAAYSLGADYYYGRGVDADGKKAEHYLLKAVSLNEDSAAFLLSDLYEREGRRVESFAWVDVGLKMRGDDDGGRIYAMEEVLGKRTFREKYKLEIEEREKAILSQYDVRGVAYLSGVEWCGRYSSGSEIH